ncbi:hypothetical protein [uncultured Sphingomonas sp.]|uniref:hypothetical protein n=1 Tax=uncultured Sphingomonas sp. TaxID=158754 RepID=UPI002626E7A6|nr:hypothetical protein [uncultured Sphingomonas sp.]
MPLRIEALLVIPPFIESDERLPFAPDCWLLAAAPPLLVSVIALVGVLVPADALDDAVAALPELPIARRIAEFIGGCDTRPLGAEAPPPADPDEAVPPVAPAPAPAPACSSKPMTNAPIIPVPSLSIPS